MRLRRPNAPARPRFLWQGVLIVLPALVLAGAALVSLRRDEVVARHEAGVQAEALVRELAERKIPELVQVDLPAAGAALGPASRPGDELLARLRASSLVASACLIGADGGLVYPPAPRGLPTPEPLDVGGLNERQQDRWIRLEEMWSGGGFAGDEVLRELLAAGVPERVAAVAEFRTAMAMGRAGREAEARALFRRLSESGGGVLSESGIPLRLLAADRLARLLPEPERGEVVNRLCRLLMAEPSEVGEVLFERATGLAPGGEEWVRVQAGHRDARALYALFAADPEPGVATFLGDPHWIWEQGVDGGRWVVAVPMAALAQAVAAVERSILKPAHFGLAVSADGAVVVPRPPEAPVLARAASAALPVTVEVFLSDPEAFSSQRRSRTMRFAGLIGVSAVAVLAGFFAAWRAFRHQLRLSEMKSNFVSSVSHELRAPIASIRLMAEELESGGSPAAEKLRRYLRFIGQECRRLSGLIENVLDVSRREQGRERFDFVPTDLEALVRETVELMRGQGAAHGVEVRTLVAGEPRPIEADGRALQRLLVNLIDNALKHAPAESVVRVGLEFEAERILLWVEDDGPGIPRAEHERIFERFYRVGSELRRRTQGVGLGLSIVKHLAEVHGGRVLVRSEPGAGSRFTVELPAALPEPGDGRPTAGAPAREAGEVIRQADVRA